MTATSRPAELLSPDERDRLSDAMRLRCYGEDWVTAPRRADSGAALGPETQKQVLALLRLGVDEAAIQHAAVQALAAEEARIARDHRLKGWLAVGVCIAIALFAAMSWEGRGEGHHLTNLLLLGAIGLMLAQAIRSRGTRLRSHLIASTEARKEIWRKAIAGLTEQVPVDTA